MTNPYEQLEQLMLHKAYEALSPDELKWVQTILSQQEYELERRILLQSKNLLQQTPAPPVHQLAKLQAIYQSSHKNTKTVLWKRPVAAYQAVMMTAAAALLMWWFKPADVQIKTETKIVYKTQTVTQTDTLYKEIIRYKDNIIYKKQTVEVPTNQVDTVYMPFANKAVFYNETVVSSEEVYKGKSLKELGPLVDFIVEVN